MNITELKATAYDLIARIQTLQNELGKVNQKIMELSASQPVDKSEVVVEENKA